MRNLVAPVVILVGSLIASRAVGQQQAVVNRPYDGIQAGLDAYRMGEEQRQANVSQQLFLNDQMRFWNGYPTSRANSIYYGYLSPAAIQAYGYGAPLAGGMPPRAFPTGMANLGYVYGYGAGPLWGGSRMNWGGPLAVFEPWPYVAGDIWGYRAYYQPARQSIGQQQTQTGPNRWESHPVYDPPLTMYQPLPPVDSPLLDRTPYGAANGGSASEEAVPPGPPATTTPPVRRGPREY